MKVTRMTVKSVCFCVSLNSVVTLLELKLHRKYIFSPVSKSRFPFLLSFFLFHISTELFEFLHFSNIQYPIWDKNRKIWTKAFLALSLSFLFCNRNHLQFYWWPRFIWISNFIWVILQILASLPTTKIVLIVNRHVKGSHFRNKFI